ncbi:MAG: hypothetical protein CME63_08455 [Halobacteriovoraceae bacterium]|nr:hypothetical protein [Halobacteriovoraceae bacterium]|tara:strand:+ start:12140 stop:12856 length:717 start_codon:yes stop_codon:yes gene_type:complete
MNVLKNAKKYLMVMALVSTSSYAAESGEVSKLENKLDALNIPDDKVTPLLSQDQLYIVNTRYSSLINRHEVTLKGGHNFTADSHLDSKDIALSYRYHLNSDWSFGVRYTEYQNDLTGAGERLFDDQKLLPDTDYSVNAKEIFATYNTIYGKLRWSQETVVYFDQYISLGVGEMELASGKTNHALADLGLAFWIGKHMSARVGLKNEFYNQTQLTGKEFKANTFGYIEFGYLFGSGDRG